MLELKSFTNQDVLFLKGEQKRRKKILLKKIP